MTTTEAVPLDRVISFTMPGLMNRTDSEAAFQEFLKRIPSASNLAAIAGSTGGLLDVLPGSSTALLTSATLPDLAQAAAAGGNQAAAVSGTGTNAAPGGAMHRVSSIDILARLATQNAPQQPAQQQPAAASTAAVYAQAAATKQEAASGGAGGAPLVTGQQLQCGGQRLPCASQCLAQMINTHDLPSSCIVCAVRSAAPLVVGPDFHAATILHPVLNGSHHLAAAAAAHQQALAAATNPAAAAAAAIQLHALSRLPAVPPPTAAVSKAAAAHANSHTHMSATSHSDGEEDMDKCENRRARRMLSNRESARRSRKRKQEHLTRLETEVRSACVWGGGAAGWALWDSRCCSVRLATPCGRSIIQEFPQ